MQEVRAWSALGDPFAVATSSVAATSTDPLTISVSPKVLPGYQASTQVFVGGFLVEPSRVSVNVARDTITVTAEVIGGSTVPFTEDDPVVIYYVSETNSAGVRGAGISWQGAWVTSTTYRRLDAVENDGSSYVCIRGHTSGASSEPETGASWETYWNLMAQAGGSGTSDHGALTGLADDDHTQYHNDTRGDARYPLKSNNLSDLASATTSRSNLGLGDSATRNVGSAAGTVCAGDDSRLSDPRAPTTHATTHQSGGSDAIKLDDLATPDDNTDLNASATRHGLLPKLPNSSSVFLDGTGAWSTPAGTVSGSGTADKVPRWTGSAALGNSRITDSTSGGYVRVESQVVQLAYNSSGTRDISVGENSSSHAASLTLYGHTTTTAKCTLTRAAGVNGAGTLENTGTGGLVLSSDASGTSGTVELRMAGFPRFQFTGDGSFGYFGCTTDGGGDIGQSSAIRPRNLYLTGKATLGATTTSAASLNLPHGTAPTSPTNGDVWTTTAGIYVRIDGATVGPLGTGGGGWSWEGNWVTSTSYQLDDVVSNGGSSYICVQAHTSGADDDEPGSGSNAGDYWDILAQAGSAGDHGSLTGLADDDHAQYHNDTRGDARYARRANDLSDLASASTARTNLGLGTIATQAASNVTITGGSISGITDLAVADGGTGASTAANARANLSAAPNDAQYLTLATNGELTNERSLSLAAIDGLVATDGGAGSTYAVAVQGPRLWLDYRNDFMAAMDDYLWLRTNSGTGSGFTTSSITHQAGHPGIARGTTGTTTTGYGGLIGASACIIPYSGQTLVFDALIYIPNLSDGTDTYRILAGFANSITGEPTAGAYFRYESGVNSGKFEIRTANNGSPTAADTGVTVTAATWYRLWVRINGTTSVDWAIYDEDGGTALASGNTTTTVPASASAGYTAALGILKSAGTTARELYVDVVSVRGTLDSTKRGGA